VGRNTAPRRSATLRDRHRRLRFARLAQEAEGTGASFLISVKAQSHSFAIITVSSGRPTGVPNLKGRRMAAFSLLSGLFQDLRNSSGSLAILAAIRRASSFVSSLAAERRPGSSS
jgi:hypothetical protein